MARPTVLVVEDDSDIRAALIELLADEGFGGVGAENGREALHLLDCGQPWPALILLDLMMPVMDGVAFRVEQLRRAEARTIPVVLLTADPNGAEHARAMGIDEHLAKPVDLPRLLDLVARYCAGAARV